MKEITIYKKIPGVPIILSMSVYTIYVLIHIYVQYNIHAYITGYSSTLYVGMARVVGVFRSLQPTFSVEIPLYSHLKKILLHFLPPRSLYAWFLDSIVHSSCIG